MFLGLIIAAVAGILAVLTHRSSRLEHKVYKHVPLVEWLNLLVYPTFFFIGWLAVIANIFTRPKTEIFPLDDFLLMSIIFFSIIYGFIGTALHFTGKILWHYLKTQPKAMAFRVNEMFHGRLSHYLTYINTMAVLFLTPLLEINHPLIDPLPHAYQALIMIIAVLCGAAFCRAIFYTNEWFGGYSRPLSFLGLMFLGVLVAIQQFYDVPFDKSPVLFFSTSVFACFVGTFALRQLFIFLRLANKNKLRYVSRFFLIAQSPHQQ